MAVRAVIFLISLAFAAVSAKTLPEVPTLVAFYQKKGLTSMAAALDASGLEPQLATMLPGLSVTVFTPDNAAFAALPAATVSALKTNMTMLRTILMNHIATVEYTAPQFKALPEGTLIPNLLKKNLKKFPSGNKMIQLIGSENAPAAYVAQLSKKDATPLKKVHYKITVQVVNKVIMPF